MEPLSSLYRSQRGSAVIYSLVGVGILGVLVFSYLNWATSIQKAKKHADLQATVRMLMDQIANAVDNDQSFYWTAANNGPLQCYINGSPCPSGNIGNIRVYLAGAAGTVFVDMTSTSGFNVQGQSCNTFDPINGNDECPLKFSVEGSITCPGGSCSTVVSPQQKVSVNPTLTAKIALIFKPRNIENFGSLNTKNIYTVDFVRGQYKSITQNYCNAIGGVYNSSSRFCTLNTQGDCPVGTYMTGLNNNGGQICQGRVAPLNAACGPGSAFVGTYNTGQFICGKY